MNRRKQGWIWNEQLEIKYLQCVGHLMSITSVIICHYKHIEINRVKPLSSCCSCFHRSLLFILIWLLHFGRPNLWTWACGSVSCSSTSFLTPGTATHCCLSTSAGCLPPSLPSARFIPSSPPLLLMFSWCVLYYTPSLIRLTAAADTAIIPWEAKVHLYCKERKSTTCFCYCTVRRSQLWLSVCRKE